MTETERLAVPAAPLLRPADLDDPEQFVAVGPVPYLDVHDDPEHGPVGEDTLAKLRDNGNRRTRSGRYTALILGHTRLPGRAGEEVPERDQPPVVGYAVDFFLAPDPNEGRPCLWAHERHARAHASELKGYPWRSVERLAPAPGSPDDDPRAHVIDRVSLLKTPPRREFTPLHYRQDPETAGLVRRHYARPLPVAGTGATDADPIPAPPETERETDPMAFDHANPDHVKALAEGMAPFLGHLLKPFIHQSIKDMIDDTPEAEPGTDNAGLEGDPEGGAPARKNYAAGEMGGNAGVIPAMAGDDEDDDEDDAAYDADMDDEGAETAPADDEDDDEGRKHYCAACQAMNDETPTRPVTRKRYSRDMTSVADVLERHEDTLAEVYRKLGESDFEKARLQYRQDLGTLAAAEGIEIDADAEVAELPMLETEAFIQRRTELMRRSYRRSPVNQAPVPVAAPAAAKKALDAADVAKIRGYSVMNRVGFDEARKALGL